MGKTVKMSEESSMIYYQDNEVLIRNLQEGDAQVITDGEIAQGWNSEGRLDKYLMRLKDQAEEPL